MSSKDEVYLDDLKGWSCPSCGQDEAFLFDTVGSIKIHKNNERSSEYRFKRVGDTATCPMCLHKDKWSNFKAAKAHSNDAPVMGFLVAWWNIYKSEAVSIKQLRSLAYKFRITWPEEEGKKDELPARVMHSSVVMSGHIVLRPLIAFEIEGAAHYRLHGKVGEEIGE